VRGAAAAGRAPLRYAAHMWPPRVPQLVLLAALAPLGLGDPPPLTRAQVEADLEQLAGALRARWSYLEDRREHFGLDLDARVAHALARVGAETSRAELADVLAELVSALADGHASVVVPDVATDRAFLWPFTLFDAAEGVLVDRVHPALEGVPQLARGDRLVTVGGRPLEELVAHELGRVAASTPGARRRAALERVRLCRSGRLALGLERADGTRYELACEPLGWSVAWGRNAVDADGVEWRRLPAADGARLGYLRVGSFTAPDAEAWSRAEPGDRDGLIAGEVARLARAFDELGELDGLVLDLRGNGGGTDLLGQALTSHLLEPGYAFYALQSRRDGRWGPITPIRPTAPAGLRRHAGPLAVLIDAGTFSAADNVASCLRDHHPDVAFVGRPTGGGTGAPRALEPLACSGAVVTVCTMRVYRADGELIDGRGVEPDVPVRWTRADLLEGGDPDLAAAVDRLARRR